MTTLVASTAVVLDGVPTEGWIAMDGERVVDRGSTRTPRGAVDLGDAIVAPGLIDLQCNGLGSVDFASASADEWHAAQRALVHHGVTALCPTLVTAPLDTYDRMLGAAAEARSETAPGEATLLGVHLEGPFLGGAPRAHDPALVRPVDVDWLDALLSRHPGLVRVVTLAPEADAALAGTAFLVDAGVVVALGHTTAPFSDAVAAADAGASMVTHLFNGMAPWHHREPGVAGAALTDARLTPTVIADLVHVHPAVLRVVFAASRVATVSDSVGNSGGLDERDGAAYLRDGTLAGASTQLDGALANLVAAGVPWLDALTSMTSTPARLIGATDRGTLRPGSVADVVALEPETLAVQRVWVRGVEARH